MAKCTIQSNFDLENCNSLSRRTHSVGVQGREGGGGESALVLGKNILIVSIYGLNVSFEMQF